jgi:endonuclease I
MKRLFLSFFLVLFTSIPFYAQAFSDYYLSAEGLSRENLKTALHRRTSKHQFLLYDELWNYFNYTDALSNNRVLDRYSLTEYVFSQSSQMDREHAFPKSWWGGATYYPVYSDLHHLYPSDRSANIAKSNNPLGKVSANPSFTNGVSKVGPSVTTGYSGTVFEPADEYKGDFARAYFYVATAYEHLFSLWNSPMLDKNTYPVFKNWAIDLLIEWHTDDPVSQLERDRNEIVYTYQDSRNPFIDYPQLVDYIWGDKQQEVFYISDVISQPTIVSPWQNDEVLFPSVFEDDEVEVTLYVRGLNLTGDLSVTVSNDANGYFSVAQATISKADAEKQTAHDIKIKFSPTEVKDATATLTVSGGGAASVTVNLLGTSLNRAVQKPEAQPISNIEDNSATLSWTGVYKATNYLLDVYKNGIPKNTVVLSEDFEGFFKTSFASNSQGAHSSDVSDSLDYFMRTKEWAGDKIYHANKTAKFGTSSTKGYMTTPVLDLSHNNGNYVLKFDAKLWVGASEKTTILILHNNVQMKEVTLTNDFQPFEFSFSNGTKESMITISAKIASNNRFFLDNIRVEQLQPEPIFVKENFNVEDVLFYDLFDLEYDTEYFYRVRANKDGDISANSNIVSFTLPFVNSIFETTNVNYDVYVQNGVMYFINLENEQELDFSIFSQLGKLVIQDTVLSNESKLYFLSPGFYILKIGKEHFVKILVTK